MTLSTQQAFTNLSRAFKLFRLHLGAVITGNKAMVDIAKHIETNLDNEDSNEWFVGGSKGEFADGKDIDFPLWVEDYSGSSVCDFYFYPMESSERYYHPGGIKNSTRIVTEHNLFDKAIKGILK